MPRRNLVLTTSEIYHIFNRSIAKQNIFGSKYMLNKVLEIIDFYRFPQEIRLSKFNKLPKEKKQSYFENYRNKNPFVEIYAFAFMPNHFHFLLKQIHENGIIKFISNYQNSFAKFFNLKNNRNGTLFENSFKAKRIESDEQFLHVSRYIHLNPVTSYIIRIKDLDTYPYTSFPIYLNNSANILIEDKFIKSFFKSIEDYKKFVFDQADYQRQLDSIKDLIME